MKKILLLVLILLVILGVWLLRKDEPQDAQSALETSRATSNEKHQALRNFPLEALAPPEKTPPALENVFKKDAQPQELINALDAFAKTVPDLSERKANEQLEKQHQTYVQALRWMLRQNSVNKSVRNEIANLLLKCGEPTLVADLLGMAADEDQLEDWRAWCLQHAAEHHQKHEDAASLAGLEEFLDAGPLPLRRQALFSLCVIAQALDWPRTKPDRMKKLVDNIKEDLDAKDQQLVTNAIDSAARLRLLEVSPAIERLALDKQSSLRIRIPAINALGAIGDPNTRTLFLRQRFKTQEPGRAGA